MRVWLVALLGLMPVASVVMAIPTPSAGYFFMSEATKALLRIAVEVTQAHFNENKAAPFSLSQERRIIHTINTLTTEMHESHASLIETVGQRMHDVIENFGERTRYIDRLQELYEIGRLVERREAGMYQILRANETVEKLTLTQYAYAIINTENRDSVVESLHRLEMLVTGSNQVHLPAERRDIFSETAKSALCSFGLSPQQLIYDLYESIATTELKGYIMMHFAYMLLKTQGHGNFTLGLQDRRNEMQTRLARTQQLVKAVMNQTSDEYWRCDPGQGKHRENVTFVQFTRLIQGYVENEVDMTPDNTCRETCSHYRYGHEQHQCYKELYCAKQTKCAGRIYDCEYIDSDMWICPSPAGSNRRYEYIEYENGEVRGRKQHCSRGTTKVESWWRWLFWHCSYCFCYCDDAGRHSDRYVSLRESVSDVENNRVVTGLRFVKHLQMVHLIVQQGLLLPGAEIANDTLEWVTAKPFSHAEKGAREGQDYHTLSYDRRAIDLDDVRVSPGYVVTGVRFRVLGTHLNLEVRMTEMNFTTGTLIEPNKFVWVGKEEADRKEIPLKYLDVPTYAPAKSIPVSNDGQYLRFGPTGGRLDAGQTTIPFLDAQPLVPVRPMPLSGAGLLYRGLPKYGGFVAPKLMTYDIGPHIQNPTDDWFTAELEARQSNRNENPTG